MGNEAVLEDKLARVGSTHAQLVQLGAGVEPGGTLQCSDDCLHAIQGGKVMLVMSRLLPHIRTKNNKQYNDKWSQHSRNLLHKEGRDAMLLGLRLGLGVHDQHVRIGAVGDPELVTSQEVALLAVCKVQW